jgi:transcriptional regulator with XRE-family HTH domain
MNDWQQWVRTTTHGAATRSISGRLGVSHSTVARWIKNNSAPCGDIIRLARQYGADPIDGLIAARRLSEEDLAPTRRRG